jgi:hypothetical protein
VTPATFLARLASLGYSPVSHGTTSYPENWYDLDGPAGTIRVVTYPGDGDRIDIYGLGLRPARPLVFEIRLSAGTPDAVIAATLTAAGDWLTGRPRAPDARPCPTRSPDGPLK